MRAAHVINGARTAGLNWWYELTVTQLITARVVSQETLRFCTACLHLTGA